MDVDPVALAAADPVPVLLPWLRANPIFNETVGGPEHVSGAVRDPYPHIVITDSPGGGPSDGYYSHDPELLLQAVSSPDGTPGKYELRRLLVITAGLLCAYPDEGITSNRAVISNVRLSSPFVYVPDPRNPTQVGGAGRWQVTLRMRVHAVYGVT